MEGDGIKYHCLLLGKEQPFDIRSVQNE